MPPKLFPHQELAVSKMRNGSILCGDTGIGKSITAAAYYIRNEVKRDVYVITTAKKRDSGDWEKEFIHFGIGTTPEATVGGTLTVDSWNNLGRYRNIAGAFFIFDEQRIVGAGEWTKNFLAIARRNRWILLSATPGDNWIDYIPVFIANGYYKNRTEFKREHVVYNTFTKFPKVDYYVGVNRLVKQRNALLVDMPYQRTTERAITKLSVGYDEVQFNRVAKDRWNIFKSKPLRDVAELFSVMRKVVNSDPTRLTAIHSLTQKHPKLIVFYNFNYELKALKEYLSQHVSGTTVAEWNGHKHQPIPDTERWVYLVQYVAGAEGWNCTSTDAMAFFSLTYSYKVWMQAFGRIDRLNTPFRTLYYYILLSNSLIDLAIMKSLDEKRSFNEKEYKGANRDK